MATDEDLMLLQRRNLELRLLCMEWELRFKELFDRFREMQQIAAQWEQIALAAIAKADKLEQDYGQRI